MYLIENVFCKFTLTEPFITFYKPKGMRVHMPGIYTKLSTKTCYLLLNLCLFTLFHKMFFKI